MIGKTMASVNGMESAMTTTDATLNRLAEGDDKVEAATYAFRTYALAMPKVFATENENKVPAAALWLTNIIVQLFVISTYWSNDAFSLMLNLTSVMALIPFLMVAAYGFMLEQVERPVDGDRRRQAERLREAVRQILEFSK